MRALGSRLHRPGCQRRPAQRGATMRAGAAAGAAAPIAPPQAPVVADLAPMIRKVRELNNGAGSLGTLVPFVVDGQVLGRMRPT